MYSVSPVMTIGMPVYNGANYIKEALDSLLAQTFTNFELIISDNASADGTEAVCREYAARDNRIRYVRHAVNLGAVANFRYVLDKAGGEYFMWAAHDDVWDKHWIATLLPIVMDDKCVAFGTVQSIDTTGCLVRHPANGRNYSYKGSKFLRRLKYYAEPSLLGKANPIYGVYPKSIITHDIFKALETGISGADMHFIYALLAYTTINARTDVFLYKRNHNACAGGSLNLNASTEVFLVKLLVFILNALKFQCRNFMDYKPLASKSENVVYAVFFLFFLIYSIFEQVINNPRVAAR